MFQFKAGFLGQIAIKNQCCGFLSQQFQSKDALPKFNEFLMILRHRVFLSQIFQSKDAPASF
jgi:hypothetical protein